MVNKLKSFYAGHTIGKIFLTILLAAALVYVLVSIPVWNVKKSAVPETASREPLTGEKLEKDAGKVVLAENGGKTLSLNTKDLTLEVKDEKGNVFSTAVQGTDSGSERALLVLTYLGEDNNIYEWNSYDQSVAFDSYELYRLENGVRIDMNLNEGFMNFCRERCPRRDLKKCLREASKLCGITASWTRQKQTGTYRPFRWYTRKVCRRNATP